jgi:hypothetical protein
VIERGGEPSTTTPSLRIQDTQSKPERQEDDWDDWWEVFQHVRRVSFSRNVWWLPMSRTRNLPATWAKELETRPRTEFEAAPHEHIQSHKKVELFKGLSSGLDN